MSADCALVMSRGQFGLEAPAVSVETHIGAGLPRFSVVGLPETAVREARDRVQSAIETCGLQFPGGRITVNLAPADLPKAGGRFDLAIALSLLSASGQLPAEGVAGLEVIGELGLFGEVRPVPGALNAALAAQRADRALMVPAGNRGELRLLGAADLVPVAHLRQACTRVQQLASGTPVAGLADCADQQPGERVDAGASHAPSGPANLADVRGQALAKRALLIAAAGGHNLLLIGPPGAGKTLLARCLPGLLPPLTRGEALQVLQVHSVAGLQNALPASADALSRPFRDPHHSASVAALIGGGSPVPHPGELSLAHQGVLFLDEMAEFQRPVLEALRQPLESGEVVLARARTRVRYPAQFQLIGAMNPCPVGRGCSGHDCQCTPAQRRQYQTRLSAPLLDRIDVQVLVRPLPGATLLARQTDEMDSAAARALVVGARERQLARSGGANRSLQGAALLDACGLSDADQKLLEALAEQHGLSARACHRLLRVARTIADLAGHARVEREALLEAFGFRSRSWLADN